MYVRVYLFFVLHAFFCVCMYMYVCMGARSSSHLHSWDFATLVMLTGHVFVTAESVHKHSTTVSITLPQHPHLDTDP